ncbi:MAG: hypothetical protein AAFR87_26075 [Bacteroidota bacterium]
MPDIGFFGYFNRLAITICPSRVIIAEVAKKANVGQSFITHYDPDHNNTFLKEMEKQCQQLFLNSRLGRVGEEVLV